MTTAKIHDLEFDGVHAAAARVPKKHINIDLSRGKYSVFRSSKTLNLKFSSNDNDLKQQMNELVGNPSFALVYLKDIAIADEGLLEGWFSITGCTRTKKPADWETWTLQAMEAHPQRMMHITRTHTWKSFWDLIVRDDWDTDTDWPASGTISLPIMSSGCDGQFGEIIWERDDPSDDWRIGTQDSLPVAVDGYKVMYRETTGEGHIIFRQLDHEWSAIDYSIFVLIRNDIGNDAGIYTRFIDIDNHYNMYVYETAGDKIKFTVTVDGSEETLAIFTNLELTVDTWYRFRIVSQGDQFECYLNEKHLGTVIDNSIAAGHCGFWSSLDDAHFSVPIVRKVKPLMIALPVDGYSAKQHVPLEPEGSEGFMQCIIAPTHHAEFLSDEGSNLVAGEVKVFDQGTGYLRRYARLSDDDMKDDADLNNSLVRIVVDDRSPANIPEFMINAYLNDAWIMLTKLFWHWDALTFAVDEESANVKNAYDIRAIEVSKEKATLEIRTELESGDETDKLPFIFRYSILRGFQGIIAESVYPNTWDFQGFGAQWAEGATSYLDFRFARMPNHDPIDAVITTTSSHNSTILHDNYVIVWDTTYDAVITIFGNQPLAGLGALIKVDTVNDRIDSVLLMHSDEYDGKFRGGIGITPFTRYETIDARTHYKLYQRSGVGSGNTEWVKQSDWSTAFDQFVVDSGADEGYAIRPTGTTPAYQAGYKLGEMPYGVYRIYVYANNPAGTPGAANIYIKIFNGTTEKYTITYQISASVMNFSWYSMTFAVPASESNADIRIGFSVSDANTCRLSHVVIEPVSNAHDFPQDLAAQGLVDSTRRMV